MTRIFAFLALLSTTAMPAWAEELGPGDFGYKHDAQWHKIYQQSLGTLNVNGPMSTLPGPGDYSYRSAELGPAYSMIFTGTRCPCASGECRPTEVRATQLGSPTGYDVLMNGGWCPVEGKDVVTDAEFASLPLDMQAMLNTEQAHICAGSTLKWDCAQVNCVRRTKEIN